jgi:hypothetical protein
MEISLIIAPAIVQYTSEEMIQDLNVEKFIDNLGIFKNNTYQKHRELGTNILKRS